MPTVTSFLFRSICVSAILLSSSQTFGDVLTEREQSALETLDPETAQQIAALAEKIEKWRTAFKVIKASVDAADVDGKLFELASEITTTVKTIPKVRALINEYEEIEQIILDANETWQTVRADPEDAFGATEVELRESAKEFAIFLAEDMLLEKLDGEFFEALNVLKNPAQFAKNFADNEITQWLAKPREAGGVTFKVLKTDPMKSLFSPQADIVIEMQYGQGIVVEAHGLYFKYADQAPFFNVAFDKCEVNPNYKATGQKYLEKGANELLSKIDGPIAVEDFKFTDFGTNKAGMECKIEIDLGKSLGIKAGGDVIIKTNGKVEWTGALTMNYPFTPPVPIGSTPLGIHEVRGAWDPKAKTANGSKRQVKVGTTISTVAEDTDKVVALIVDIGFDFPVRAVDMDGTVSFGTTPIGDIWGTLDLDKEIAEAQFRIPGRGSVIPTTVFKMDARTTITREGLESVGNCKLFGMTLDKSRLFLANNGYGTLTIESWDICGVDIAPRLNAGFKPGLSEVWASVVFETKVDLGFASLLDVAVEVEANSKRKDYPVHVIVNVWGEKISFDLPSLEALDEKAIANAVKEHLPDLYDAALQAMARGEKGARDALAKAEKDFKREVSEALEKGGFDAVRTGNKDVDAALGKMSTAGKQAGGELAEQNAQIGKTLTELRKNPSGTVESLVGNITSNPTSVLPNPGKIFGLGGGGKKPESSGPSREEIERQVRRAKVEYSLEQLRGKLNAVAIHRTGPKDDRTSGRDKYANESAVNVSFRNASSELQGNHDAVLALLIGCSDFHSRINTRTTSRGVAGSDAQVATVHLTKLVADTGESRPRAKINVPDLKHVSELDSRLLSLREIQRLVELYVPNVQVEGPRMHFESELRVANRCSEPITVWVQGRFRSVRDSQFVWNWAPGEPGSDKTYRFTIDPGKTELLEISSRFPSDDSTVDSEAQPLTANRVRLWVESESGERWMTYQDKDLWLLQPNSSLDEARGYFAEKPRVYTHVVEPKSGGHIYNDRVVRMTNKTKEPLKVSLSYRANEGGQTAWRTIKDFTVGAGASGYPATSEGMRLRASQIRFTAKSENYYYGEHERNPLSMVEETEGKRLYYAESIGVFDHTFEAPAVQPVPSTK